MAYRTNIVLTFGKISTLVSLDGAVSDSSKDTGFKNVCIGPAGDPADSAAHAPSAIRQSYGCPQCSNDDRTTFKKASVEGKDVYKVVEQSEIVDTKAAVIGTTKEIIEFSAFPATDVAEALIQGDKTYQLSPAKPALMQHYSMIVDLVRRHPELAFLGLWTPVSQTGLFQLGLHGNTLVIQGRSRPEELKIVTQDIIPMPAGTEAKLDTILPDVQTFDPAQFADGYSVAIAALLASKDAEEGFSVARAKSTAGAVAPAGTVDLMSLIDGLAAA